MAQRIPNSVIENIRNQSNIINIVGQYVQLKKAGKNYSGLCPFHNEKTPSFTVNEEKQMFYCFGCGKGGNVFKFIEEIDGVTFPEAVVKVADLSQIDISNEYTAPEESTKVSSSTGNQLIELHEKAVDVFHHILLNTKAGKLALDYLEKRGLTKEIITEFKIGFAPKERNLLQKVFKNDQVSDHLLEASGLFLKRDDGQFLDRFYQRIIFPIRNSQGKTVAFSGRVLATEEYDVKDMPKYLNSPETEIFNKRFVLFNFDKARSEIRKENEVVLFEGFMDVIAAWRSGIKNGIASMGTSLTEDQIRGIQRICQNILVCYDGDNAGIEATFRGVQLLSKVQNLDVGVLSLPEGLDPDDYIKKYGEKSFQSIVHHGRETIFSFKMKYYKKQKNLHNEKDRLDFIQQMLTELLEVPSIVEREVYFEQLSELTGIMQETLETQFQMMRRGSVAQSPVGVKSHNFHFNERNHPIEADQVIVKQVMPKSQVEKAEQLVLYRIMTEISVYHQLKTQHTFAFVHDIYQEIYLLFDSYMMEHQTMEATEFLDYLQNDRLKNKVVEVLYLSIGEESSKQEITDCLKVMENSSVSEAIQQKKQAQLEASKLGNKELESKLAIEIINLSRKLKNS